MTRANDRILLLALAWWLVSAGQTDAGIMASFGGRFDGSLPSSVQEPFDIMIELDNGNDSLTSQRWLASDVRSIQLRSGSYTAWLDTTKLLTLSTNALGALETASLYLAAGRAGSDSLGGFFTPSLQPLNTLYRTSLGETAPISAASIAALTDSQDLTGWSIERIDNASVPEPMSLAIWSFVGASSLLIRRSRREPVIA